MLLQWLRYNFDSVFQIVLITDWSFNPRWHGCQYRRQICRHVYKDKDPEADQAHQGNLSPVDLDQEMIKGNPNKSVLHRKSTIYVSVHMDVNKNYKIYENTFSVVTTR